MAPRRQVVLQTMRNGARVLETVARNVCVMSLPEDVGADVVFKIDCPVRAMSTVVFAHGLAHPDDDATVQRLGWGIGGEMLDRKSVV